jgi:acetolactate synthase-1/2/3 large subunit
MASGIETSVSDVIAGYLKGSGIGHVFGYPGDPSVELIESLRRNNVAFVTAGREGTAAFMAQAYGQITGRPGTCLSTLGPGSSSMVNGIANAFLDKVPMLAISGQIETKRIATFTHQVLDHALMFAPITKYQAEVRRDNVAGVMRRALRTAVAGRPGPVHITTPADVVGAAAIDTRIVNLPSTMKISNATVRTADGGPDPDVAIRNAKSPVIVVGIGQSRTKNSDALVRLSEALGCPVVVAPMAKGIMPEDNDYYAGTLDMACNALMWDFLKKADLILAVGFDAVELIKPWTPAAPVIHIDTVENTDQIYSAETEIVGDISTILDDLSRSFKGEPKWSRSRIADHRSNLVSAYESGRVAGKLNPTDVVRIVRDAMPRNAVATTDVGSHKLLVGQGWTSFMPGSLLMTNGLSSMGYSLPAAIAAATIDTRPVICFVGDGGFAMVEGELRLAASLKAAMRVVVFCDNSLNRIELKQAAKGYPSTGTRLEAIDIAASAKAHGCEGVNVSTPAELERVMAEKPPADRPLVIGANIDPTQYQAQF